MEAYKLTIHPLPRSQYEALTDDELILFIQEQIIETFVFFSPEERIKIRALTMDSVPLELLGGSHQKLGIAIMNVLEQFELFCSIPVYQESVMFPDVGVLIGFVFHHITEQKNHR